MLRRFPVYGSGLVALLALHLITFATLHAQQAWSADSSFDSIETLHSSTLDVSVEAQDLDLEAGILNIIGGDPFEGIAKPIEGPLLQPIAKPEAKTETKPEKLAKKESKGRVSPFTKWVSPKTPVEDTAPEAIVSDQSKAKASDSEVAMPEVSKRELTEPQLARRARPIPAARKQTRSVSQTPATPPSMARVTKQPKKLVVEMPADPKSSEGPSVEFPINPPKTSRTDLPQLTKSQQQLRAKVRRVLTHYYNRPLNTRDRSPWELMHAMLAYEVHSKVLQGGPNGKPITAVGWLCFNQACRKRTLMYVKDSGELQVRVGPALQGHRGQLLAMLAQSKVKEDYPMRIDNQDFTVADLIDMEKRTCYPRTELTFKLIALSHYLDEGATWMNDQGMQWNVPKLISEEMRQPVRGAACGGTHRLSGLTLAYKDHVRRGEPLTGQYLKAKQFVTRYQQYAYKLQNRDGSFSTEWFRGPGDKQDIDRKLKTTGHLLEWLLYAGSEKEQRHWKTAKAANYLASIMYNNRYKDWEAGPLGHAVHALLLYDRIVFGPYDQPGQSPIAGKPKRTASSRQKR